MRKTIISLILLLIPLIQAQAAEAPALKEDAPERYIVVPGDTLWSIAGRFLKDPWKWPELWKMNQEQIKDPHRIYPGDVIVLDRSGAAAQLRLERAALPTVRLSPQVRAEPLKDKAIPAISPNVIEPFLTRPLVVGPGELDSAPVVLATQENRVAVSAGDIAYVEGLPQNGSGLWQVFRRGDALVDPDTNEILGYLANYLGEVRVLKPGAQSTVQVVRAQQEIYAGDRLVSAAKERPTFSYVPRAPKVSVRGRIMTTYGNLGETGPAGIVALSKGAKDGLEVGHVLAIYRSQSTAQYEMRTSPLYGRQGPSGSDAPRSYYGEVITPRDGPLVSRGQPISAESVARLPDERYGLVMIFRTFDRAAFGLVMQASRPVAVNDVVANP